MSILGAIRGETRAARRDANYADDTEFTDPGREIQSRRDAVASRRNTGLDAPAYAPDAIYPGQQAYYAQPHHQMLHHMPEHAMNLLDRRPAGGQRTLRPFQYLHDIHAWPGVGAAAFTGVGFGVHSEGWHQWIGGGMIGFGALAAAAVAGAHLVDYVNGGRPAEAGDPFITRGTAMGGLGLIAGGTACAAGPTWVALMAALPELIAAYLGWHQWLHHKLERQRDFVVNYHDVTNPGAAPVPPASTPMPVPSGPQYASFDAVRLMQAFEDMKVSPVRIKMIRESGEDTRTAVVVLPPGSNISPQAVIAKRKELMNNLGCRHVEIVPTGPKNEIQVTWFDGDDDRLADTILWPGPSITSFEEPIALGLFENLDVVEQDFLWLHTLIAGATDNGKSGVVNVILCSTLPCTDLVRIGIDCKDGAPELGPYKRVMFHLATNPEEGMRTLNGVRAIIKARGEFLGAESEISDDNEDGVPVRKWDTKYGPYILVPLDELAELTREYGDQAGKELESIRQLGRYVGVHCLDATQYPSKGVFGGKTDPRQQYQVRIGMSCPEAASINVIFGTGAQGAGWRLEQLKYKGSFMIKSRAHQYPRNARAYYVTDETIAAMVKEWSGKVPDLDAMSAEAFHAAYAMPLKPQGGPNRPGGRRTGDDDDDFEAPVSAGHRVRLHAVPDVRYPSKNPKTRGEPVEAHLADLWQAFVSKTSSSVDDLVDLQLERLKSRDSVRKVLRAWVNAGYAWKSEDGRYYPEPDLYRKEA